MSQIIDITPRGTIQTLDQLWREAEQLGRIKVDSSTWSREQPYEVEIVFTRRSGTRVHAKARHMSINCALADAINEAREMGAGEQQ